MFRHSRCALKGSEYLALKKRKTFFCLFVKSVLSFIALASSFTIECYERKELSAVLGDQCVKESLLKRQFNKLIKQASSELNSGQCEKRFWLAAQFDRPAVNVLFLSHRKKCFLLKYNFCENRFSLILASHSEW